MEIKDYQSIDGTKTFDSLEALPHKIIVKAKNPTSLNISKDTAPPKPTFCPIPDIPGKIKKDAKISSIVDRSISKMDEKEKEKTKTDRSKS